MVHLRSLTRDTPIGDITKRSIEATRRYGVGTVIWNVTRKCNLRCGHCYVGESFDSGNELTTEEAEQVISELGDTGVPLVFLSGGEPLLREDIFSLLRSCQDHGVRAVVSSNGGLLTSRSMEKMRDHGVDYVALPMYGPRGFHDAAVGMEGMFDQLVDTVRGCVDEGLRVCLKTVVTRHSLEYIPWILETGMELGASAFYVCELLHTGRAAGSLGLNVSPQEWRRLADYMIGTVLSNPVEIDVGACPSLGIYALKRFEERGLDVEAGWDRLSRKSSCPVGEGFAGISADGDVLPCNFMQNYRIGSVRESSLREIFADPPPELSRKKELLQGRCGTCEYRDLCGGCRARAYFSTGDILSEDSLCLLDHEQNGDLE